MKTLYAYASNKYSDNGEDGILAEINKRLGIKTGWFVEFGASDGIRASNSYALLESGWQGVDIEGDHHAYTELQETAKKHPGRLHTIEAFVSDEGPNSLDNLFAGTPLPKDFDMLSVDIDSHDYWLWRALKNYQPKVVVIEINSSIKPGVMHVQPKEEGVIGEGGSGSSFSSMLELGREKGYTFVCHTGNMIFVRNDLVAKLNIPAEELADPNAQFRTELIPVNMSLPARVLRKLMPKPKQ